MDTGMNKLIKGLSLAAGGSHYPTINPHLQRRFAELIVEHIVRRINNEIDLATEQEQVYAAGALQVLAQQISQDFGIAMSAD